MLKNKKALTTQAIIRLLIGITAFLLLFLYPASKLYGSLFGQDEKYLNSFETFVEEINNMDRLGIKSVNIKLDEESAIIGFSKDSDQFTHLLSLTGPKDIQEVQHLKKPDRAECINSPCICLCSDLDSDGEELTCKNLECRSLNTDIISSTPIYIESFPNPTTFSYWKNGFLYGRSTDEDFNGLPEKNTENFLLRIEKKPIGNKKYIGICKQEWFDEITIGSLRNSRKDLFGDKCIVTELDEVKEYKERYDDSVVYYHYETFIAKNNEFIEKYEKGKEVEEALFQIGEFYTELGQTDKAIETFTILLNIENPITNFPDKANKIISQLKDPEAEIEQS